MNRSPGHAKYPHHKVLEETLREPMQVEVNGEVIADKVHEIRIQAA